MTQLVLAGASIEISKRGGAYDQFVVRGPCEGEPPPRDFGEKLGAGSRMLRRLPQARCDRDEIRPPQHDSCVPDRQFAFGRARIDKRAGVEIVRFEKFADLYGPLLGPRTFAENQAVARAGHRNVKEPRRLGVILILQFVAIFYEGWIGNFILCAAVGITNQKSVV